MPDDNEILFAAEVDDSGLAEFAGVFEKYMQEMAIAAEQGFDKVDKRIEKTGRKSAILGGIVAGLANQFVAMGMKAVAGVKNFVSSSIQLAARLDVLETVLKRVGMQAGYSTVQLANFEAEVKSSGITTEAARQSMLLMIRANIDLEHASNLATIAQNAAVIAGINSSQAFERLILGIQKGEPELLDELQITLDRERAYSSLAAQLGKSKDALTDAQKQEAIIQDIYKQSTGIIGVYDDAMGDAGKQAGSLARHIDNLKELIGSTFQEAYSEQISFMTEMLVDLATWFEENEESVQEFGDMITSVLKTATALLDIVLKQLIELPGKIKGWGMSLAGFFNDIFAQLSEKEMQRRMDNIGLYFKDALLLISTLVAGFVSALVNVVLFAARLIKNYIKVLKGEIRTWDALKDAVSEDWEAMGSNIRRDMLRTSESVRSSLFGIEEGAEDAKEEIQQLNKAILELGESSPAAIQQVTDIFDAEEEKREEAKAKRSLKASRDETERELRDSWRRQDIERKFQEGLDSIEEGAEEDRTEGHEDYLEARKEAAKDNSDDLLQIEEAYQKRLRDIQEDFEYNAEEFARKRDAIGLLRLQRQKNKELKKADDNRKEARKKANKSYDKQLEDIEKNYKEIQKEIDDSITEQLDALEDARKKDYENYERSLDRQKEIRDLHEQWAQDDRDKANQKWLDDQGHVFSQIEGLTFTGLMAIASQYEGYYGDMTEMYKNFLRDMTVASDEWDGAIFIPTREIYDENIYGGGKEYPYGIPPGHEDYEEPEDEEEFDPYDQGEIHREYPLPPLDDEGNYDPFKDPAFIDWWYSWRDPHYDPAHPDPYNPFEDPYFWQWYFARYGSESRVYGQAGQVSSLLAGIGGGGMPGLTVPQEPSRLPATGPISSTDRREIHITADLLGVDPYIQQSVINTMLEIERNRGSGS
jgi:hypothetical protein